MEIGTCWYWAGKHWRIQRTGTKDGEPAVGLVPITAGPKVRPRTWIITRLLERHALPSEA